ncbi:MAG: metalloregulator ArsR/SmtB family transcription factor [Candidatus Muiribacteriota bacterium]
MKKFNESYLYRSKVFKALAHPARLYIVELLDEKSLCVNEITEQIGTDVSTVSRHLLVLKNAGIIDSLKKGLNVQYFLKIKCVNSFFTCLEEFTKESNNDTNTIVKKYKCSIKK